MKKQIPLLFFAVILFLMTGCPYDSKTGLSDPVNSTIDTLLIGEWTGKSIRDSSDVVELNILKFNTNEYLVDFKGTDRKGRVDLQKWRGFITIIENKKIMNLTILGEKDEEFIYLKYETDGSTIKASYASDNFIKKKITTQQGLYNYFKDNINKKGFFEDELVFKKKN